MENNTTQLKKFTPETMKEIVYVTWPTLAPAGDKAAWVDWKGSIIIWYGDREMHSLLK